MNVKVWLIFLLQCLFCEFVLPRKDYTGYRYYIVDPQTDEQKYFLMRLEFDWRGFEQQPDFWVRVNTHGKMVEVLIAPADVDYFESKLTEHGLAVDRVSSNVQNEIDKENEDSDDTTFKVAYEREVWYGESCCYYNHPGGAGSFKTTKYNTYQAISDYIKGLATNEASYMEASSIGQTAEGNEIQYLRIGKDDSLAAGTCKPSIFIEGGMHPREYVSMAILALITLQFSSLNTVYPQAREYLDDITFHFVPVSNPDGYDYAWTEDRFWRKNRSPLDSSCNGAEQFETSEKFLTMLYRLWNYCNSTTTDISPAQGDPSKCCVGTNLNANFDYNWDISKPLPAADATVRNQTMDCMHNAMYWDSVVNDKCTEHYRGSAAFSEPETMAIRDKIRELHGGECIKAFISIHSFGNKVIYPFSDKNEYPDKDKLVALAESATEAMKNIYGKTYTTLELNDALMGGLSTDWAKDSEGIPYAFGIESRPDNKNKPLGNMGFVLHRNQIPWAAAEAWAAIKIIANKVIEEFVDKK